MGEETKFIAAWWNSRNVADSQGKSTITEVQQAGTKIVLRKKRGEVNRHAPGQTTETILLLANVLFTFAKRHVC